MSLKGFWKNRRHPSISFEFFPPKDDKSAARLDKAIEKVAGLKPDFVSVTFGAGGSTRDGSYELVKKIKENHDLEVVAYIAAVGLTRKNIMDIAGEYRDLGVETVLCIRGDTQQMEESSKPGGEFKHASDFIRFMKSNFDFCIGAAGYPEGHYESETPDSDLGYLELKLKNGADFIISQYCYDNTRFFNFLERCQNREMFAPTLAGIMPIYSVAMTKNLSKLCGTTITGEILKVFRNMSAEDKEAVLSFGIDFAYKQCQELIRHGVDGLHFYTMNRSKTVTQVVRRLRDDGLLPVPA